MSLRICTRAAPRPSERLTPASAMPRRAGSPEVSFMRLIRRLCAGPRVASSYGSSGVAWSSMLRTCCSLLRSLLDARAGRTAARAAGQDRGARRFARRRVSACRQATPFRRRLEAALKAKGIAARSPMPASPATPPAAGSRGSTGRCRRAPTPSSSSSAPTTCCAGSTRRSPARRSTRSCSGSSERHIAVLLARHAGRAQPRAPTMRAPSRRSIRSSPPNTGCCSIRSSWRASPPTPAQPGRRLHPNAAGVDVIVARILPKVEELIARSALQAPQACAASAMPSCCTCCDSPSPRGRRCHAASLHRS